MNGSMTLHPVLTIGHSSHSWEYFARLLRSACVTAIADVRSTPFSRRTPQFNRDTLKGALREIGIAYSFLGRELGGRPKDASLFCDGTADYDKMAKTVAFQEGLNRVINGSRDYRVALLCSEHDPLDCHRCLLVGSHLAQRHIDVQHIISDGSIRSHDSIEERLLTLVDGRNDDLFIPREERLAAAYRERSRRVAFVEPPSSETAAG